MSGFAKFKNVVRDPHPKKNILRILYEAFVWMIRYRELPKFYFGHRLYHRGKPNVHDYLSKRDSFYLLNLNRRTGKNYLKGYCDNKVLFDLVITEAKLPVPQLLGYKIGNRVYYKYKDEVYTITDKESLKNILVTILQDTVVIFIKPINAYGGKNCFLLSKENVTDIYTKLFNMGEFLFQKKLEQHAAVNKIYPYAINTVRFDSYTDDNGRTTILNALIRFGTKKSVVDNASSGGFFVNVDLETGRIFPQGVQFLVHGYDVFYKHPDTQTILADYQLPHFDDAKKLVVKASKVLPLRIAGWDIAITPDGPVVIEVNDIPMITMSDTAFGGYKKNKIIRELLKKQR